MAGTIIEDATTLEETVLGNFYSCIINKLNCNMMKQIFESKEIGKFVVSEKISKSIIDKYRMEGGKIAKKIFKSINFKVPAKLFFKKQALESWFVDRFTFPMASINLFLFNLSDEYWKPIKENPNANKEGLKKYINNTLGTEFIPRENCYPFYNKFKAEDFEELSKSALDNIYKSIHDLIDQIIDEKINKNIANSGNTSKT